MNRKTPKRGTRGEKGREKGGSCTQLPKVRSNSGPSRSRDLDYVADDGNDEGGGYNPGIQRSASAAGKTRCSGALGPPEVSTPLSINAETMRCALRSDVPVAMSTSPRGISPPR